MGLARAWIGGGDSGDRNTVKNPISSYHSAPSYPCEACSPTGGVGNFIAPSDFGTAAVASFPRGTNEEDIDPLGLFGDSLGESNGAFAIDGLLTSRPSSPPVDMTSA